jgi:hypothetical protein
MTEFQNPTLPAANLEWQTFRLRDGTFSMQLKHLPTGFVVNRQYDRETPVMRVAGELKLELELKLAGSPVASNPDGRPESD